jgi:hypothetical protein
MTIEDYSRIYMKPWTNRCKKEKKENKMTKEVAKRSRSRSERGGTVAQRAGQEGVKINVTTYNHASPCACILPWWASVRETGMENIIWSSMLSGPKWLGAIAKFSGKGNGCMVAGSATMSDPA